MRLGYACINTELRARGIFCSRSCVMKTLIDKGVDAGTQYVKSLARQNIMDLLKILEWNEARGIRLFRLTSNLFPHVGNVLIPAKFREKSYFRGDIRFAAPLLAQVGKYAREHGHRLTFHMNPFIQFGSPNRGIVERGVFDVVTYGKVLRALGTPDGCIVIHIGGIYQGDQDLDMAKQATMGRWLRTYRRIPLLARQWIVLENDERCYGVGDVLPFCEANGIPMCFDIFHNSISKDHVPVTPALLRRILRTWPRERMPKFHLSEQAPDAAFGAHANTVKKIPDFVFRIKNIDLMIECKHKQISVLYLLKKYFKFNQDRREWVLKRQI